jgi:hypothetical protein
MSLAETLDRDEDDEELKLSLFELIELLEAEVEKAQREVAAKEAELLEAFRAHYRVSRRLET